MSEKIRAGLAPGRSHTADNTRLILNVCFNYGGRWDIAQGRPRWPPRGEAITEARWTVPWPGPCARPRPLIRTGGELRISNFLLWQAAYSELYFSDRLWPDFDEAALDEAIADYAARERRFGQTSEQIASASRAEAGLKGRHAQTARHHGPGPAGHSAAGPVSSPVPFAVVALVLWLPAPGSGGA